MTTRLTESLDLRHLRYFAVAAEELNLSRAARRLFMSQPPLSRHIRRLEELLGVQLFVRHTRGLSLTADGARVLEAIRPLLAMQEEVFGTLAGMRETGGRVPAVGLTTAFEQGVFAALETRLGEAYGDGLRLKRATSPQLARDVRRGRLDAAFVALPLDAPGLHVLPLDYEEPLVAVLPAAWPESGRERQTLAGLSGRPLFWFRHEEHPAYHEHTRRVFVQAGFAPVLRDEPAEHDVLLARIAAGEGMGLFPASFRAIRREGVVFSALAEGGLLGIRLGLVTAGGREELAEDIAALFRAASG
jgi:DNA-binding transcriptional LysR family regulator